MSYDLHQQCLLCSGKGHVELGALLFYNLPEPRIITLVERPIEFAATSPLVTCSSCLGSGLLVHFSHLDKWMDELHKRMVSNADVPEDYETLGRLLTMRLNLERLYELATKGLTRDRLSPSIVQRIHAMWQQ